MESNPCPEDLHKFSNLLSCLVSDCKGLKDDVSKALDFVGENYKTEKGLTFLELKNSLLLNYLIDLNFLMLRKLQTGSLKDEATIMRLIEYRLVLEKMRPIEKELRYQIDKAVKSATSGSSNQSLLQCKPNPSSMRPKLGTNDEETNADFGADEGRSERKGQKYVPPRLVATFYDGQEEKQQRLMERARRKALSSSLIQELHEQYTDAPEEIQDYEQLSKRRSRAEERQKTEHEEDFLMRFRTTKKQKGSQKRFASELDSVLDFGNYRAFDGPSANKRTKSGSKNIKHGKSGKKTGFKKRKQKR